MDTELKREIRYITIKVSDANQLNRSEQKSLSHICNTINEIRAKRGKDELNCVCVESDWPEYEPVWAMIEARMSKNEPNSQSLNSAIELANKLGFKQQAKSMKVTCDLSQLKAFYEAAIAKRTNS